jgi:hypothetical protein
MALLVLGIKDLWKRLVDFKEIWQGGNAIQGVLDLIIFNFKHFKMTEVRTCELDARFSALLSNGLGLSALLVTMVTSHTIFSRLSIGNQGTQFTKCSEIILN